MNHSTTLPRKASSSTADLSLAQLPIFFDPEVSRLKRAAVIDVGSNSVRVVVFDGAARSPAYFYNEKVMCGLGASLATTGRLDVEGRTRALAAIRRFVSIAEGMRVSVLLGVATAAVRDSSDGKEFCDEVARETGLALTVASGEEEARLSAQGVILGWPEACGLVCDLGGASMELAEVCERNIGTVHTSPLGPLVVEGSSDSHNERLEFIKAEMAKLRRDFREHYDTIYLVGGAWRAISRLDMERRNYPLHVMNEYKMSCDDVRRTVDWVNDPETESVRRNISLSSDRMKLVPTAGLVLLSLIDTFGPSVLAVSAYGIREGILYDQMPDKLRLRDPLIEACLFAEYTSSRLPGYGRHLYEFVKPLYKKVGRQRLRLIRAACILHDVSWRAHPDYRAVVCFDFATRSNMGGLDHAGRVFLALTLFHRYKNRGKSDYVSERMSILGETDIELAEQVGKAIRFGAMLTGVSPEALGRLKFKSKKHVIELLIPHTFKNILGEVVESRFRAVAKAMNCEPRIVVV